MSASADTTEGGDDLEEGSPAFTSRITAAFRVVEAETCSPPILEDPLAPALAGHAALRIARSDAAALAAAQGPSKHLRIPARNRLLDDDIGAAVQRLRGGAAAGGGAGGAPPTLQLVNLGAGMDTRPWRLPLPGVRCFCVDQPPVMELKQQLLRDAGAETTRGGGAERHEFPLTCAGWAGVAADLSRVRLRDALLGRDAPGFDAAVPTVWVAEALLYYLKLDEACALLADMAALSAPGSCLLATCIDEALLVASQRMSDHYFAQLWFFCIDDLLGETRARDGGDAPQPEAAPRPGGALWAAGWRLEGVPRTTRELALQRYAMDTYVALYGGAECVLRANLRRGHD